MPLSARLAFVLLAGALLMAPRGALADSDGYYCVGKRYLAYQFSFSKAPSDQHILTIVWLADEDGGISATDVALDMFQAHNMRCTDEAVEILSFDTLYRIDLTQGGAPLAATKAPLDGDINTLQAANPAAYPIDLNLGEWHRERARSDRPKGANITPLSPPENRHRYFLHINTYVEVEARGGGTDSYRYVQSQIVKKSDFRITDIFNIYSGGEREHSGE